jgi:DinB superfamily
MNAIDVLGYGHTTVLDTIERVPEGAWDAPGAVGQWSPKDVIGHIGAFELMLGQILESLETPNAGPLVEQWLAQGEDAWNEAQWELRRTLPARALIDEYAAAYDHSFSLVSRIPAGVFSTPGLLPWYGPDYDLGDFIVYSIYGHKREHTGQVGTFLDRWQQQ